MDEGSLFCDSKLLVLKKDLKRAKLFAINYLTRRIRMLRNKRGTEQQVGKNNRKADRFEEELECIKDLEISTVLDKIENKILTSTTPHAPEDSQDIQERALARLISSKPVQNRLKDSNERVSANHPKPSNRNVSHAKMRQTEMKKENFKKERKEWGTAAKLSQDTVISSDTTDDESDNSLEISEEIILERTPSSFFVKSLASLADGNGSNKKPKVKSNGLSRKPNAERKLKKEPKSSNRLGQRARQRLWEQRYGNMANHIKTSHKDDGKKMKNAGKHKSSRMVDSEINRKEKVYETVSHPSWEASRRRKLQQSISQTQFQGQKITFEDSD